LRRGTVFCADGYKSETLVALRLLLVSRLLAPIERPQLDNEKQGQFDMKKIKLIAGTCALSAILMTSQTASAQGGTTGGTTGTTGGTTGTTGGTTGTTGGTTGTTGGTTGTTTDDTTGGTATTDDTPTTAGTTTTDDRDDDDTDYGWLGLLGLAGLAGLRKKPERHVVSHNDTPRTNSPTR
jgi:MYXO-CTERM domain-containing protein